MVNPTQAQLAFQPGAAPRSLAFSQPPLLYGESGGGRGIRPSRDSLSAGAMHEPHAGYFVLHAPCCWQEKHSRHVLAVRAARFGDLLRYAPQNSESSCFSCSTILRTPTKNPALRGERWRQGHTPQPRFFVGWRVERVLVGKIFKY